MKKLLLATLVAGLMSVNAMAVDGTVGDVIVKADGTIKMYLVKADGTGKINKTIVGVDADAKKAMLATALTAKSGGSNIAAYHDGTSWTTITAK